MLSNIESCCSLRTGPEWCRLTNDCRGWGCRLLTVIPTSIPSSEQERGKLFSQVYRLAETIGVLSCPYFRESELDRLVEDDALLAKLKNLPKNLQI